MIKNHYLINLKHREDRLWAWIGGMHRHDFDLDKLTVVEAINGNSLAEQEFKDLASFIDSEHSDLWRSAPVSLIGNSALLLTERLILKRVAEEDEDNFSFIWEDDMVLRENYSVLEEAVSHAPVDSDVLLFARNIVRKRPTHPKSPFFIGIVGNRGPQCMAFTPKGAEKLLKLTVSCEFRGGLENMLLKNNADESGYYTYIPHLIDPQQALFAVRTDMISEPYKPPRYLKPLKFNA